VLTSIDQSTIASTPLAATQWSLRGPGQHDDETHPEEGAERPCTLAKILLERMGLGEEVNGKRECSPTL